MSYRLRASRKEILNIGIIYFEVVCLLLSVSDFIFFRPPALCLSFFFDRGDNPGPSLQFRIYRVVVLNVPLLQLLYLALNIFLLQDGVAFVVDEHVESF